MKKTLIALFLMLPLMAMGQQVSEEKKQEIERLEKVAQNEFNKKNYTACIDSAQRVIDLIEASGYDAVNPVTKPMMMNLQGRCYHREKRTFKAVEMAKKYIEVYGKNVSDNDLNYYNFVDNLSLYLLAASKTDEALEMNLKAGEYLEREARYTIDHAAVLIHRADIYSEMNQYKKAVDAMNSVLSIYEKIHFKHSEEYIGELTYLQRLYKKMGDDKKADKLSSTVEKLVEETKYGYIPKKQTIDSKEEAHNSMEDALMCCKYLTTHKLSDPNRKKAEIYIISWATNSPDVAIELNTDVMKWAAKENGAKLLSALMAGWSADAITKKNKEKSFSAYASGMVAVLNTYLSNKEELGEIPELDEYINLYEKGEDALAERLTKDFEQMENKKQ